MAAVRVSGGQTSSADKKRQTAAMTVWRFFAQWYSMFD